MSVLGTAGDLLTTLGADFASIPLLVPALAQTPNNTVPSSSAYPMLVRALQTGLNRRGAGLKVDGRLGPKTNAAAVQVLGANWRLMTWGEIFTKLAKSGPKIGEAMPQAASMLGGIPTWVLLAGGGVFLVYLLKKKGRRR